MSKKLTIKDIEKRVKAEYPYGVDLIYVDYSDNLDESHDLMEKLAQTGSLGDNIYLDWNLYEAEWETMRNIKKEVFTENEILEIDDNMELSDAFKDICYEIDTSNYENDVLKNTFRRFFYYDLNHYVEPNSPYNDNTEVEARKIAQKLRIKYSKHKDDLLELVENSYFGGDLVVLFTAEPINLLDYSEKQPEYIAFKGKFEICIMDRAGGSGHSVEFKNLPVLEAEFIRTNLHDDRGASGYSYAYDVCGLITWDTATIIYPKKPKKPIKVAENEDAKEFAEREAEYEATYKAGKCTFGDMKYKRHRNTEYINEYPCGNKCKDCGTFWID